MNATAGLSGLEPKSLYAGGWCPPEGTSAEAGTQDAPSEQLGEGTTPSVKAHVGDYAAHEIVQLRATRSRILSIHLRNPTVKSGFFYTSRVDEVTRLPIALKEFLGGLSDEGGHNANEG